MLEEVIQTNWRVLALEERHPAEIVAMEDVLLDGVSRKAVPNTIAFHRWRPAAISLAKFQTLRDVDVAQCARDGVCVVRTTVGGRAVYHNPDHNFSFCIAMDGSTVPQGVFDDQTKLYVFFLERIIAALNTFGIPAEIVENNYIRVKDKKLAGTAMRIKRSPGKEGALLHGMMLYDIPDVNAYVARMMRLMRLDDSRRKEIGDEIARTITPLRWYDKNLQMPDICAAIVRQFTDNPASGTLSTAEVQAMQTLAREKYASTEWHKGTQELGLCFKRYGPIPKSSTITVETD